MSKEQTSSWKPSSELYGWSFETDVLRNCVNLQDYNSTTGERETCSSEPCESSGLFSETIGNSAETLDSSRLEGNSSQSSTKTLKSEFVTAKEKCKSHIFKTDNPNSSEEHLTDVRKKKTAGKRSLEKKIHGTSSKFKTEKRASTSFNSRILDPHMPLNNSKIPKTSGSSNPTAFIDNLHTKRQSSDFRIQQEEKFEKIKAKRDFKNRNNRNVNVLVKNNYWSGFIKNLLDELSSRLKIYLSMLSDLLFCATIICLSYLWKGLQLLFRLLSITVMIGVYFSLSYILTFVSFMKSRFKKTKPIANDEIFWGEKENIKLPTTGDEAIARLLSSEGKDAYSILGLKWNASDEDIKKYYRKQAVLVHPDKNAKPGAETAFKILGQAFEMIGSNIARKAYDAQMKDTEQRLQAQHNFEDLLDKLKTKLGEAVNTMRCSNCGNAHKRTPTDKVKDLARYCSGCRDYHSASDGDVWAETRLAFIWHYYWCVDGCVYDITDYAQCNFSSMKAIRPNSHIVQLKMGFKQKRPNNKFDDFLRDLYERAGTTPNDSNQPQQPQHQQQSQDKQKKKKKGKRR